VKEEGSEGGGSGRRGQEGGGRGGGRGASRRKGLEGPVAGEGGKKEGEGEAGEGELGKGEVTYRASCGRADLPTIMELVDEQLSEPDSIFTYRYGTRTVQSIVPYSTV